MSDPRRSIHNEAASRAIGGMGHYRYAPAPSPEAQLMEGASRAADPEPDDEPDVVDMMERAERYSRRSHDDE